MVSMEILTQRSSSTFLNNKFMEVYMMWHTAREKKSGRRRGEMGLNNTEDETKFLLECCPIFSQWCLSFSSKLLNVMETCPFCYLIPYPFVCYTHSSVLVGLGGVKKKKKQGLHLYEESWSKNTAMKISENWID